MFTSSSVEICNFSGIFWRLKERINGAAKHQVPISQLRDVVSQKNGILSYTAGRTYDFAITLFYTRRKFVSEANRQEVTSDSPRKNNVSVKKWFIPLYIWYLQPDSCPCFRYTGLFISPSGISELDCATTKTDATERSISIGRESPQVFFLY